MYMKAWISNTDLKPDVRIQSKRLCIMSLAGCMVSSARLGKTWELFCFLPPRLLVLSGTISNPKFFDLYNFKTHWKLCKVFSAEKNANVYISATYLHRMSSEAFRSHSENFRLRFFQPNSKPALQTQEFSSYCVTSWSWKLLANKGW